MIKNIVFSSGGILGATYIGCLKILYENKILNNIENILGCSSGSLFAICICLGYKYIELYKIFININLNITEDIDCNGVLNFIENFGLQNGQRIIKIMEALLKAKTQNSNITFLELFVLTQKRLIITATCLNTNTLEYFDYIKYPNMKVIDALRMSIAIPFLFNPVKYENKYYVDGAVIDAYPIKYFNNEIRNTIGILINDIHEENNINNIEDYIGSIIFCNLVNHKKLTYEKFKDNTILINSNFNSLNFNLTKEEKEELIKCGSECTSKYINNKNFLELIENSKKNNKDNNKDNSKENSKNNKQINIKADNQINITFLNNVTKSLNVSNNLNASKNTINLEN